MPTSGHFRFAIAAYLRELSDWRRRRYDDDLRDSRNLRSADALLDLSLYIEQLGSDDVRLLRIAELTADGTRFVPGQQLSYEMGRYHFHDTSLSHDSFLGIMVTLAERDGGEQGRFGGPQVTGDNPWH